MPAREVLVPSPDWAYFLDIDGTLVALTGSPAGVRIDPILRRVVESIHADTEGAVALITGRPLSDVDRLFPKLSLPAAGQHGIERRDASGRIHLHPFPSERLDEVRSRLANAIVGHPGLFLEDKGLSLALHYRGAPRLGGYAHRLARLQAIRLGSAYCLQSGKRVVEIKPAGQDKGKAIGEFMSERPFRKRTPVFIGDDLTDEFGFVMVNQLGGYSIKVGPGATAARWRLSDVRAVRTWLQTGRIMLLATR